MKAVVQDKFGGPEVLEVRDLPVPEPDSGQVLVQVYASNINPIDWKMREGEMAARYGDEFPMLLGWDCSGVIADVGPGVTDFKVGDEVFARSDVSTGRCYAEFALINTSTLCKKPANCSFAEAGSVPLVGLTAINGLLNCARLREGQRVVIIGASGGVGTLAVQIAKIKGAHVTGVCSSNNVELVRSLGADQVIDYQQDDALEAAAAYNIIYDTIGVSSAGAARKALTQDGTYLTLVPVPDIEFFIPGKTDWAPGKGYFVAWTPCAKDLQLLAGWMEAGSLKAVIDSTFTLEQIREAHLRSQTERAVGKIVVQVRQG